MKRLLVAGLGTMGALAVCLGVWVLWGRVYGVTTGELNVPMAEQRTVENVSCTGSCTNVTLTSDQAPGTVYLENTDYDSCIPVTLWANRMRENQIGVNGYLFDLGGQMNLRPITVDATLIDGTRITFVVDDAVAPWYERYIPAVFTFTLHDRGDWNLIDPETFTAVNGEGVRVKTDYDTASVTLFDGCSAESKDLATYALYQSPELVWPGEEQTYRVVIVRRGAYGESTATEDVTIFERIYTQRELEAQSIPVEAVDGNVTLSFNLVKEE